jgi:heptosyltransferase-2
MSRAIPEKILVRGVNWLGDAVMTTPALLRLREALPRAHITLLTHAKLGGLWQGHPALDAVETFSTEENSWRVGRRLRDGTFDLAIVLPNSPRSALDVWWAGIPRRIGYAQPWRNLLLTETIPLRPDMVEMHKRTEPEIRELIQRGTIEPPPPASAHQMFHYLHLVATLGGNPEPLPPKLVVAENAVEQFAKKFGLDAAPGQMWLGMNPTAEYGPAKRWPEERFTEAAIEVRRRTNCRWLIFGLGSDAEMCGRIAENISRATGEDAAMNLAGKTNLAELCAAAKFCRVMLTNDSGPMHLAAALGTPVVVPFGSTSPELTGPGLPGDSHNQILRVPVPCSPCFLRECPIDFRCMKNITTEMVVSSVLKLL